MPTLFDREKKRFLQTYKRLPLEVERAEGMYVHTTDGETYLDFLGGIAVNALGNDEGYDQVFVQQLRTFARPVDLLISISGSGNSPNVLRAVEYAQSNSIGTLGITGFSGGRLREIADACVHVPLNDMCTAESVHSVILHYVIIELQKKMKDANAQLAAVS